MKSYWINITNDCNLDCVYCYQKNRNKSKMTIETAEKIVDQIKKTKESGKIIFFGGEPLLNFEVIRFVTDTLTKVSELDFVFTFTTNLTLLTDDILQYIQVNNIKLMISLDGNEETYNMNRFNVSNNVNYFEIVNNNMKKIINSGYDKVVISKVVSANNYYKLFDDTLFLSNFNYPIHYNFDMNVDDWDNGDIDWVKFDLELKKVVDFYVEHSNKNIVFIDNFFQKFKSLFNCPINIEKRPSCNNNDDIIYSFDVHGNLSPCHFLNEAYDDMIDDIKSRDFSELSLKLSNNNIYHDLDNEEMYSLIHEETKCKNCSTCNYNFMCLPILINRVKECCFLMKFKLRKNIYKMKGTFCFNKFIYDYIYEIINSGRISINDFTEQ